MEAEKLELTPKEEHDLSLYLVFNLWVERTKDQLGMGKCWGCNCYVIHPPDCPSLLPRLV